MKYIILLFAASCMITTLRAQTLQGYLEEASRNNPSLKAAYSRFEASLKQASQVNALPDPQVSIGYFISPIETRLGAQRAKMTLSQMFPWFGTLKAKEQVAALQAEAQYQHFLEEKNLLHYNVKQAYYPLYQAKEHLRLERENLTILETYRQLAITSFTNGKGQMTDVLRVEIIMEDVKSDIQILASQIKPLEVNFNRLLNRADTATVVIADTLRVENHAPMLSKDSIASSHPKINVLEKQLLSLQAQEVVARKSSMPQIGVGLDYAFILERTDMDVPDNGRDAFMPMVTMSIPLSRKKYRSAVEESQLLQQSVMHRIKATENTLAANYEQSRFELGKTRQLDSLYHIQLQKSRQTLNLLYTAYSNSGKDFEEVLRMQQQLLKYEMAQATVSTQYHIALARLTYITAKPE